MNKKILGILCVIFINNYAIADRQSYGPIIQRQSKQINDLNSRVLELENTVEDLRVVLKNNELLNKESTITPIEPPSVVVGGAAAKYSGAASVPNDPKDKIAYDLALAALKEGRFDASEQQFFDFMQKYPSSKFQSNATFWYGETFYRRGLFNKAAINYLQSYKKYPKGSKASDVLLKLSYSLASLNKNEEACSMLKKLDLEFPKRPSSSIKRATEAKTKFHCK